MAEAVGYAILGRIGENLVDPIGRQFGYLFCFNRNIQNLQTQHDVLKATREGVQLGVNEARNNVRIVEPLVEAWLNNANTKIEEAETTIASKARVQTGCLKGWCWPRYSLGRKAAKMTQDLVDLCTEGSKYTQLSHSPPPPCIQSLPSTGFKGFESRNLIVKQIIEALKDDEINLVGLCGMGGVGKTTMVKHVEERVKEEKLFDEVAMAVVSQEPNLKQVQSCIADMLNLKLHDRESPIARARLLHQRLLLDNKKILVILDDIWKEFDLAELGIPLGGSSNKSCKILFTSRNGNIWKGMQNKRYIELQVLVGEEPWHLFSENIGDCVDDLDLLPLAKDIVNECGGLPLALATIGRALTNEHSQHHWKNALQQLRNPCSESLSSEVPAEKFGNISVIGKLLNLEILCFRDSDIEELPEEIGELVNLKLLDLTRCGELKRIVPGVISALVQLQELYMDGCKISWEREGKEGGENASLREFESLSNLNTLEINIEDVKCLPRIPLFSKFTKYSICIGFDEGRLFHAAHITSVGKLLKLCGQCTIPSECVNSLLRSSAVLELRGMGSEDAVQELFREGVEGLQHLKDLVIDDCATPECFVNTMEWVPRTPNAIPHIFPILEKLELVDLPNLKKICHCQLSTGSFGKLKHLKIENCDRMEEVIWKEKGEDEATSKMEFPALESMTLKGLPMLIGFCRGTGEIEFPQLKKLSLGRLPQLKWLFRNSSNPFSDSMENHNATFRSLFSHKVAFPSLEKLELCGCQNVNEIWCNKLQTGSFNKLFSLNVSDCGSLRNMFSPSMARHLVHLKMLFISSRSMMEVVVAKEEDEEDEEGRINRTPLPKLEYLKLKDLPECSECFVNTMEWVPRTPNAIPPIFPTLKTLNLMYLPNLRKICHCQLPTGSFAKLEDLGIYGCDRMDEVIWKEKGEDDATNKMEFPALESMTLSNLPMLIGFCRGTDEIEFPQLKELSLRRLPQLKWLFLNSSNPFSESMENHNATFLSLFPHKVAFPSLEELELHGFQNMNQIWCNQLQAGSFNKLFSLDVSDCGSLRNMFSPFMARHLVHLKWLTITRCRMMEEVVAKEEDEEDEEGRINRTPLPKLESLKLEDLPELKSFCHVTHNWKLPLVEHITVLNCPKMKTFSPAVICTPKLQCVFVKKWGNKWSPGIEGEDWLWISDLNQTITHLIEKHDLADEEGENEETL
ncbi:putative disease resistance protein [Camellia lanceoleosa]|uniref:Disease resistance protein n=1 Tax=Camellia lanceoleosa TaxID=1840588 RepID=A0ACC0FVU8_9ERIC|nr:putative disease resistance protein [Camellia lanceoleosa]